VSIERRPTKDQIVLLQCVDASGSSDAPAIAARARRRKLYPVDVRAALSRLCARDYLHQRGTRPVEYYLTQKGQLLLQSMFDGRGRPLSR
jgi:hypothetical protein